MPIRPHLKYLYPIDWPQLSALIRFDRAKGRCEGCGRPHGVKVRHLGDGRWYDEERAHWRCGKGRALPRLTMDPGQGATTTVYLATAHLDHDPGNSNPRNLKALCSGATCCTIARSIIGSDGSRYACARRSATSS